MAIKIIRSFNIDTSSLPATAVMRSFTIIGDPGAVFSLVVKNGEVKYYNFEDTNSTLGVFQTTRTRLLEAKIPDSGKYKGYINFPAVSDNDQYDIELWAEPHFDTKHIDYSEILNTDGTINTSKSFGSDSLLLQKTIYQYIDIDIRFKPDSKTLDTNYKTMPDDIIISASRYSSIKQSHTANISWVIESNPSSTNTFALFVIRQPLETDFEIKINGQVDGAITSSTTIVLDSVDNITEGMYITGTGITSTSPTITNVNKSTKTITVSSAQTLTDERALVFWGEGRTSINNFNGADITFSDLEIVLDPLVVTVDGATTTSRNITLDDAGGIRVGADATIKGIGFDNSTIQRPTAINYSTKVLQVTSNQSLKDGTILEVDGYGKKATITGTITVSKVPSSNFTVYFDVEAVVTALTS